MYNQRSAYWDELQFVEDSMNLRNIGRYTNVNLTKCNKNSPTSLGSEMNCGFEHKCS